MALYNSPQIVTNGLILYYDMQNTQKSWKGQPTTNLIGDGMSIYNNVPGDVSATLVTTDETYKNAPIYKLTLTPITPSGVSYLTAGNNPGIGVVTSGGGGIANRYTGHAIFYRSTVPLHSTPLFTNYSNISGWGAGSLGSNRSVNMNDGWFRGEVIWFDSVTRSDGKYWAINPANATLNIPIIIYWAGPFKEDRNDIEFIAPYTPSNRSNTQTLLDLTGQNTLTAQSLTYGSNGTFSFNGSTNFLEIPQPAITLSPNNWSISFWLNPDNKNGFILTPNSAGIDHWIEYDSASQRVNVRITESSDINNRSRVGTANTVPINTWSFVTVTISNLTIRIYVNGTLTNEYVETIPIANWGGTWRVGQRGNNTNYYSGRLSSMTVHNRALTAQEISQNFSALRGRYGI